MSDAFGAAIDEPEDGCPEDGFKEENLLKDIDGGFYGVVSSRDIERLLGIGGAGGGGTGAAVPAPAPARPAPDEDSDGIPSNIDGIRVRVGEGRSVKTGTLRTRDGAGDVNIPAHKVLIIFDGMAGGHMLLRQCALLPVAPPCARFIRCRVCPAALCSFHALHSHVPHITRVACDVAVMKLLLRSLSFVRKTIQYMLHSEVFGFSVPVATLWTPLSLATWR